jgi:uncharacterized protein YndB with AHSA1/START domain
MAEVTPEAARRTITLERFYDAPVETVWELWTTKAGIESWWGPTGFTTEVTAIDVRPGGRIVYVMTATDPEMKEFLERQGMPPATQQVLTIHEVAPHRRLVTTNVVDFIPGIPAYEVGMVVDMEAAGARTRLVVTLDAMHDQHWTEMAVKGWEGQLENLARMVAQAGAH